MQGNAGGSRHSVPKMGHPKRSSWAIMFSGHGDVMEDSQQGPWCTAADPLHHARHALGQVLLPSPQMGSTSALQPHGWFPSFSTHRPVRISSPTLSCTLVVGSSTQRLSGPSCRHRWVMPPPSQSASSLQAWPQGPQNRGGSVVPRVMLSRRQEDPTVVHWENPVNLTQMGAPSISQDASGARAHSHWRQSPSVVVDGSIPYAQVSSHPSGGVRHSATHAAV